jgi:hypothetical protein
MNLNSACLLLILLPAFALPSEGAAPTQSPLPHGSHKVGFKQQWHFDYGRTYQMRLKDGKSYASGKAPRPILMNLWYPATPGSQAKPMPYSAYLDFAKGHPEIKPWLQAFLDYNRGIVCHEVMGVDEKDLKPAQRTAYLQFLNGPTRSFPNSPSAKGKYPVVIYHQGNGSSIEDNSDFCEYMASWGYVVVSSSYVAGDGTSFNIDSKAGSAADIRFLTAYLRTLPNVDWEHIGLIGHSGGAHTALKYRAVPGVITDAIVSLDTTEDYYSLADPRWTFIKHDILPNIENMSGPIMMVANPYAYFELADKLTNADRCYFTVKLDHNEFISQGLQRLRVGAPLAEAAKQAEAVANLKTIEASYARLCEYVRFYFDAKLKGKSEDLGKQTATYSNTQLGGDLPHVELVPKGVATPPEFLAESGRLPEPRHLRGLIAKQGAAKTVEIIRAAHAKDPKAPIFHPIFVYSLQYDLFKTNRNDDAKSIYTAYTSLDIKAGEMFVNQAWFGDVTKNYAFAEECLNMLLTLEPNHAEGKKMLEEIRKKMKQ